MEALLNSATHEYQSGFVRHYIDLGRAEGEPLGRAQGRVSGRVDGAMRALLTVLDARGIELGDDALTRIPDCTDLDQIGRWIHRAATADPAEEFDA